MGLKRHKRESTVSKASHEIAQAVLAVSKKCDLTHYETIQILTELIQSEVKYGIRFERHGNYETPGGLEE